MKLFRTNISASCMKGLTDITVPDIIHPDKPHPDNPQSDITEALKGHRVLWKIEICYIIRMT